MKRDEALEMVKDKVPSGNLVKHMLAVEACMRKLAINFDEDEKKWSLAGLLHDLDYERTKNDFEKHGVVSAEILSKKEISTDIINAIKAHAGKKSPENKMEWCLYSSDPLTGLIVAAALMHPEKKLASVNKEFILNRFKEKRFAAGADRNQISSCERTGLKLEEFISICLDAMKEIDEELGL